MCTNLSSKYYEAAVKEKAKYKCPTCDLTSKGDLSSLGTLMTRLQTSLKCDIGKVGDNVTELKAEIRTLKERIDENTKEVTELRASVSFLSEGYEAHRSKIQQLETEVSKINHHLESNDSATLHAKLEETEAYSRRNNLELHGIPQLPNEDVYEVVRLVVSFFGVELQLKDIDVAHRINSYKTEAPKPIIVKFCSRRLKQEILDRARAKRKESN